MMSTGRQNQEDRYCDNTVDNFNLQVVTFLILCNLGLWITYNFEIQKVAATPDQVNSMPSKEFFSPHSDESFNAWTIRWSFMGSFLGS